MYCRMQLNVMCNLSYATTQMCSCMCRMQLNFSCKRQLQNPKFLVVCDIPLQRSQQGLQLYFRLHCNPRFAQEVMCLQSYESPSCDDALPIP